MPFRALLFDVGETLWHARGAPPPGEFRRLAAERAAAALAAMRLSHADPARAARVAWDAMEAAIARARSTDLREGDYAVAARDALATIGLHLTSPQARDFLEAIYVSGVDGGKAAYPDAAPVLETLASRGFRLAIVTNRAFGGERFREDLAATGLDRGWEAVVVSVEVGYLKPHPRIFQRALACLDVAPAEALMVGNSLAEDIAGAQALGIAGAWRRSEPDAEGVAPDFVFDELAELLTIPALKAAG